MNKVYTVPAISCDHCTATIERELQFVEGVESVSADQRSKRVTVTVTDAAVLQAVEATLEEIGYPAGEEGVKPTVILEI